MNKTLQAVNDLANSIKDTDAALMDEYSRKAVQAAQDREKAAQAKDNAKTEDAFEKAMESERIARDRETFYRKRIAELSTLDPRMDPAEYDKAVAQVDCAMKSAANIYREIMEKSMADIIAARTEYLTMASEADAVLDNLDARANVLQSRYQANPATGRADSREWRNHAKRYSNGTATEYAIRKNGNPMEDPITIYAQADRAARLTMEAN